MKESVVVERFPVFWSVFYKEIHPFGMSQGRLQPCRSEVIYLRTKGFPPAYSSLAEFNVGGAFFFPTISLIRHVRKERSGAAQPLPSFFNSEDQLSCLDFLILFA